MIQKVLSELRKLPLVLHVLAGIALLGIVLGVYRMIVGLRSHDEPERSVPVGHLDQLRPWP
ncbi:MAG: hypothetical protein IPM16_00905 [Chloroflexi bacterium]|nr:hypothetical protein [Chloroflexota bacterium]